MKRRWALTLGAVLILASGGGYAWWRSRQVPAPDERTFEDIPTPEYEKWMQELGYTE